MIDVYADVALSSIHRVLLGKHSTVSVVNFRDPNMFVAGKIHSHVELWNMIIQGYQDRETILGYISRMIDIREFLRPFKGVFKGVRYDCFSPPKKVFSNHPSCKGFAKSTSKEIQCRSQNHCQ